MDEKILRIVASKLKAYKDQPMNDERLSAIRAAVYSATKTNKSASFVNVKKWVAAARSEMKKAEKSAKAKPAPKAKASKGKAPVPSKKVAMESREPEIPQVSRKVEDSVNVIKDEVAVAPLTEVNLPKPTIVFDKVYLQSIKFEIAGIRQAMERVSRQLDKLERELANHGED